MEALLLGWQVILAHISGCLATEPGDITKVSTAHCPGWPKIKNKIKGKI